MLCRILTNVLLHIAVCNLCSRITVDPCAEIVRELTEATVETLPDVVKRARKLRADGGV